MSACFGSKMSVAAERTSAAGAPTAAAEAVMHADDAVRIRTAEE